MSRRSLPWVLALIMALSVLTGTPRTALAVDEAKYIYDAAALPNGDLGILYIQGGRISYGVLDPTTNSWSKQEIIEGKDAALALDSDGVPHVAYITTGDDLGYTYFDGDSWSDSQIIDSLNFNDVPGILTRPDIEVDSESHVHIAYHDSEGGYSGGNDYPPYDVDDLMYATNSSGSFVTVVRSYSHGWFYSPDGDRAWIKQPAKITLVSGEYRIGAERYRYDKWSTTQYHEYYYDFYAPPADPSDDLSLLIRSSTTNSDVFTLYEVDSDDTNAYSLYKRSGNLCVAAGITELPSPTKAFAGTTADMVIDGSGAIHYAGISANSLLLYQDGAFKEDLALPNSISTTHPRMVTVVIGDVQAVLYTDVDGDLLVCGVSTTVGDDSVSAFSIPDKLPVAITGIDVNDKTYDGSAASYTGSPSATIIGSEDPAVIEEYTYTWYDATADEVLASAPSDAGSYSLIVAVPESDGMYTGTLEVSFEIEPKGLTISGVTATDKTYDATTNIAITGGSLVGVVDGDTVSPTVPTTGSISNANSGSSKAVTLPDISLSGADASNYTLTQPTGITVNVSKASLTVTTVNISDKTYDGTTDADASSVTFTGLVGEESLTMDTDYTVAAAFANPGAYFDKAVTGTVSLLSTTIANNYSLDDGSFESIANVARAGGLAATDPSDIPMLKNRVAEYTFDLTTIGLSESDTGPVTYAVDWLFGGDLFATTPLTIDPDGETLRFTSAGLSAGTASQVIRIGTQNYTGATATLTFVLVDKTPVTITGVGVTNKTYDGNAVSYTGTPSATLTATGETAAIDEYTYTWYDVTADDVLSSAPDNAGSYKLIVAVSDEDGTYAGSLDVPFTISKKALTVKPRDYSIYTDADLPAPEVEYVGLVNGETGTDVVNLSEAFEMEIQDGEGHVLADSEVKGTYDIVFSNSPTITSDNYTVTTTDGALTIRNKPSSGGGGSTPIVIETSSGTTTAKPQTSMMSDGKAKATISNTDAEAIIEAGMSEDTNRIVIAPFLPSDVEHASVGLSRTSVSGLIEAGVEVTIDTPVAAVGLSDDALSSIAGTAGTMVTVEAQQLQGGAVRISINVDDEELDGVGNVTATLPLDVASPSAIVVLVKDDGTEEVLRKSAITEEGITVLLQGSATIKIVENEKWFEDLAPTHWANEAVTFASARELFTGTGGGNFSPEAPMNRGMFVTVLHRLESEVLAGSTHSFEDVQQDAWYADGVAWATEEGIVQGFGGGRFDPEQSITREQLAVMMHNYAKAVGLDVSASEDIAIFADGDQVADWAQEAMRYVVGAGLMSGRGEGILDPKAGATRAEVAAILQRLITKVVVQGS